MAEVLHVEKRTSRGTKNARRQRAAGTIPAILYGHGKETVSLSVPANEIAAAIRHGSRLVQLEGEVKDNALLRAVQWDTFGTDVLHVDLTRVSVDERITVNLRVEIRGTAPGTKEGGTVQHLVHEVEVECPAMAIPEKLELNINTLGLDETLTVADLKLPEGATLLLPEDKVLVQCVEVQELEELDEGISAPAEPEVIGRKEEEGESE